MKSYIKVDESTKELVLDLPENWAKHRDAILAEMQMEFAYEPLGPGTLEKMNEHLSQWCKTQFGEAN
jgi:hypothetical protein